MATGLAGYISSCVVTFCILMAVAFMHLIAWFDVAVNDYGLYNAREDAHWVNSTLHLLLPSWIFPIWITMYVWQGIWILYGLWLIILEQRSGWLYNKPSLTPPSTYLSTAISLAAILGWLVLFDHGTFSNYSALCLLASSGFSFLALGRSLAKSVKYCAMVKVNCPGDVALSRVLVHNGLAFMATWTVILMLYQISQLLCKGRYVTDLYAGFIFLGILLAYEIIVFAADVFLARNITGGLLAPYVLVALTFTQSVLINFQTTNHLFMVSIVMLGFSVLLFLTKLVVDIQRVGLPRDRY